MAPVQRRKWSDADMKLAYDDVIQNGVNVSEATRRHNVPRITLLDRVKGRIHLDSKLGRPQALTIEDEATLVRYITYMAQRRHPVTREQIIGLAWAIALRNGSKCFPETGPTFKWWRGFRDRHRHEIALRKPESVDHGRVANARPEIVSDYFDVLNTILEENDLKKKPHLVFNCDEAAVFLDKSSKRVVVPRQSKHCHMLAQGTSQHITVLCCVSAAGATVPPLMVFTKGLPSVRAMKDDGPINGTFSSSDSGFV